MKKVLGIDLGTSSLGWTVLDPSAGTIIAAGVHMFPEGVENLGQGEREQSPNAGRREARQRRRQLFRRKLRKQHLLRALHERGMAPGTWEELKTSPEHFTEWFRLNPYALRVKGLAEPLTPMEFGRVLYHLSQRRGFQSNSRSQMAETSEKSPIMAGTAAKDGAAAKPGIADLKEILDHTGQTLGEYLAALHPVHSAPFAPQHERIRNRWTSRAMYIAEFERLWDAQALHHPALLTRAFREELGGRRGKAVGAAAGSDTYERTGILWHQRPLRSQRGNVGRCRFEPTKPRIPKSHPLFEEARALQFINSVHVNGNPLEQPERAKALKWLMGKDRDPKFSALVKHLKPRDGHNTFNYPDAGKQDARVPGCPTTAKLASKRAFGKDWAGLSPKQREDRWHVIYNADDAEWLEGYAQTSWGLDEERARYVARKLSLAEGYGALSRRALTRLLPFLRRGAVYSDAVALGGVVNGFGESWNDLSEEDRLTIEHEVLGIIQRSPSGGYLPELQEYLQEAWGLTERQLSKLYHHSVDQSLVTGRRRIHKQAPDELAPGQTPTTQHAFDKQITGLKNPVVERALFELRKVVNTVADAYGHRDGVPFDAIHLEMGKDLKGNREARQHIKSGQKAREERNREVVERLHEGGVRPTYANRLKYKLWEECQHTCPYTGDSIGFSDLFGDAPRFEIEHIQPFSRTLDDSWTNKTLCRVDINRAKGNQTPFEYYSEEEWPAVKARALKLFHTSPEYPNRYAKFKRFASEELPEGFLARQLNDTRYAAREARKLLQQIARRREDVLVLPGRLTADLRHLWGLNKILQPGEDAEQAREKNREDNRHHAIDAVVVACSTQAAFQKLAEWNKYGRTEGKRFEVPVPKGWADVSAFRRDVEHAVDAIHVSFRKNNRVLTKGKVSYRDKKGVLRRNDLRSARGQLHKESVYGLREAPDGTQAFHIRKPVTAVTNVKQLNKVVDPEVRRRLRAVARAAGVDLENSKAPFPKDVFAATNARGEVEYKVTMRNRRGADVPIKRVRMRENLSKAVALDGEETPNQHVNPSNNHHVVVYEAADGTLAENVVTLWEATARRNAGDPVIQLPTGGLRVVTTLEINDMFLLGLQRDFELEGADARLVSQHLYRVQKLSSRYYTFRHHLASTIQHADQEVRIQSFKKFETMNPVKVRVNAAGVVLPA